MENEAEEDFLLLVLRAAHFNAEKRGSVQPYITKDIVLKRKYYLPELVRQQKFLSENQEMFEKIREQEKEVEELSVESDRLRSFGNLSIFRRLFFGFRRYTCAQKENSL